MYTWLTFRSVQILFQVLFKLLVTTSRLYDKEKVDIVVLFVKLSALGY